MAKVDLSIIIPARNEMFLVNTVDDLLKNIRGKTEIIIGCDGNWPYPPIADHPAVHMVHHSHSIGQRAITNECARISRAKYLMKVDAHCAFDEGFDVKMMVDMHDDWTMVPVMRNLHVFDWVCDKCNDHRYQGPTPTSCPKCDNKENFHREMKWNPKTNPQSTAYCFDSEPHFQYFRGFKDRPAGKGQFTETMSLQGSCFMVTRDKYWELNLCDEAFGSWGSQGIEVAVKTWLSGGRVICNHNTWYAHCFRTQGGDFGFPYEMSGRQVDRAKKYARDLFFQNKWPHQKHPLSWLIDKFWPIPGWSDDDRMAVREQGKGFGSSRFGTKTDIPTGIISTSTNLTEPHPLSRSLHLDRRGKEMPPLAVGLTSQLSTRAISTQDIVSEGNQGEVERITTGGVIANNMIKSRDIFPSSVGNRRNKPSVHKPMGIVNLVSNAGVSIPSLDGSPLPNPALGNGVNHNFGENSFDISCGEGGNSEVIHGSNLSHKKALRKGIVYYTDCTLDPIILRAVQQQLINSCNGTELVSVSLKPLEFGKNIVLCLERGYLAMAKQQLAGLEASTADVIFFCEHDILYPKCHFDFVPPRKDTFYYNLNWWKVRMSDGQALHFKAKQVSGLCAYRDILIDYYRNRVRMIESGEIGGRRHFEPGSHYRDAYSKLTPLGFDTWWSEVPYVDIRHDTALTRNIFDPSGYRGRVVDWTMADEIPFWGRTKGRFNEFLQEAVK